MDVKSSAIVVLVGLTGLFAGCEASKSEKAAEPQKGGANAATAVAPSPASPAKPEPTMAELNAFKPPTAKGKVFFKDLKDGAKISGKAFMGAVAVKLQMVAEGMTVEPSGAVHQNAGHFAVGIDAEPVPQGTAIKKGYQVYEKGETEVQSGVRAGAHTLTLQLVDARNRSYGPEWAQTIKIKVTEK
ncbi:MAG: hypothetical protein RL685_1831 [Pseudomonadota bacterium]|jgi:hypothetical protein